MERNAIILSSVNLRANGFAGFSIYSSILVGGKENEPKSQTEEAKRLDGTQGPRLPLPALFIFGGEMLFLTFRPGERVMLLGIFEDQKASERETALFHRQDDDISQGQGIITTTALTC